MDPDRGSSIRPSQTGASQWQRSPVIQSPDGLWVNGYPVIEAWEKPLMRRLGELVVGKGDGVVLEVGFGMGWSADAIAQHGCRHHTIIEAHPKIVSQARRWASLQVHPVTILEGFWQDVVPTLQCRFDGILFDTCPVNESERNCWHYPFLPIAWDLLNPGGVFTYYSNENSDFRAQHHCLLEKLFPVFRLERVDGLQPPDTCLYWRGDHMVVPVINKPT
ncbi:MAG: putative guanidinoacetate N-methyltransferase [Magnetococcales bacterium]|nr:putative guanidinoacetate N-methyltransferase [Magnetococcales bacterium]HIJ85098.1 class I SAM-dependent methyltransferase [Magnetococcales bacterium]